MSQVKLPKDRENLVLDNLNLVHYCLKKNFHMSPVHEEYEDYFQEGCIGLIISAIRFDESLGFKFSTFAYRNICGSIQRYKRDRKNIVKLPRDKFNLIMKVASLFSNGYTISEIEDITGYSGLDIRQAISLSVVDSLDRTITDDSNLSLEDTISSCSLDDFEELLSEDHILNCIKIVSQKLKTDLHRNIWEEYIYSSLYGEKLPQRYLASKYKICQAQIARILKNCKTMFVKVLAQ